MQQIMNNNFVMNTVIDDNKNIQDDITETMPKNDVYLTQNHLERVVTGLDDDSISTIQIELHQVEDGHHKYLTTGYSPVGKSASGGLRISDQSYVVMGSQVSQTDNINSFRCKYY